MNHDVLQALLGVAIYYCIPSSALMSCHLSTVKSCRPRVIGLGVVCRDGGVTLHCPVVEDRRASVLSSCRGVVVVLHCCRRARWARICTVVPAQGAPAPALARFARARPVRAGSGGVLAWASSGVIRARVGSGVIRGARPAIISLGHTYQTRGQLLSARSRVTRAYTIWLVVRGRGIAHAS